MKKGFIDAFDAVVKLNETKMIWPNIERKNSLKQ